MITKLRAVRLASRSATSTIIVSGTEERVLNKIGAGEAAARFYTLVRKSWRHANSGWGALYWLKVESPWIGVRVPH